MAVSTSGFAVAVATWSSRVGTRSGPVHPGGRYVSATTKPSRMPCFIRQWTDCWMMGWNRVNHNKASRVSRLTKCAHYDSLVNPPLPTAKGVLHPVQPKQSKPKVRSNVTQSSLYIFIAVKQSILCFECTGQGSSGQNYDKNEWNEFVWWNLVDLYWLCMYWLVCWCQWRQQT